MINNRLFKKINSIFWGILSWLPVFQALWSTLCYALSLDINSNADFSFNAIFTEIYQDLLIGLAGFDNPLIPIFSRILSIFSFEVEPIYVSCLLVILSWYCFCQVLRLFAYVFVWFINFIYDLFDYLSLNKRSEN